MSDPLRVAVIGAGKIGKQHAKWYLAAGCRLVGFLGSSPESVARTGAALQEQLGVSVPGYTDFSRLVAEARPAAVSVCSPHALHCGHVLQAVEAGLHVLCEKPLAWDVGKPHAAVLKDARAMVAAAERAGVLLGMNAQYATAVPYCRQWHEQLLGPVGPVTRLEMVMQSRGRAGGAEYADIWTDLASHPLSVFLRWLPGARLVPESIECSISRKEVSALFRCLPPAGPPCECRISLANVPEGRIRRCLGVNGFVLEYTGRNNAEGVFRAYLSHAGEEREYPDFMQSSIEGFVHAVRGEGQLPVPAADALRNLEMQLSILERGIVRD